MTDGQYTLDADPMVLAARVKALEEVCDIASGILVDLTRATRAVTAQCDLALSSDRPLQAKAIGDQMDVLNHIHDRAHAMSVRMGRSY